MDSAMIKKWISVAAVAAPAIVGIGSFANAYLDKVFVSHAEYDDRQAKQERLLQDLRVDASIQIMENRRLTLEDRLTMLDMCETMPACKFKDTVPTLKERTKRELQVVTEALQRWRKEKTTPN
jgi:hypothetical protein